MSTIINTDLFLVTRAGTNYQVTAADVSAFTGGTYTGSSPIVVTGTAISLDIGLGNTTNGGFLKASTDVRNGPPAAGTGQLQAIDGTLYWDNNQGLLFIRYNDGTSTQWVQVIPSGGGGGGTGTVTSVNVSGGTTGLTYSGGPITASGTITMAGVLGVANGGTGQTTAQAAIDALLPTQTGNSGKYLTTNGSVTAWSATPLNGAASLAEAAAGTITDKYSSPQTAVPKDASGMAGAALLPGSAAAFSGTAATGMIRYNNLTPPAVIEYYNGSAWVALGGLAAASLAQAATGTSNAVANTPQTSVPKDASGMTGAALLPSGTNAQKPGTPVTGMTRFNTDTDSLEVYNGTVWKSVVSSIGDPGGWFGHSSTPS